MTKRFFGVVGVLGMLSGFGVMQVSAADDGYSQPPQAATVCDAGHGAFGAFSHHFAFQDPAGFNWIAADAKEDGGLGAATGPTNSDLGRACAGLNP
jgi:hypothetical protein